MTHSSHSVKLKLDPKIERTFHILRRATNQITVEETSNRSIELSPRFEFIGFKICSIKLELVGYTHI